MYDKTNYYRDEVRSLRGTTTAKPDSFQSAIAPGLLDVIKTVVNLDPTGLLVKSGISALVEFLDGLDSSSTDGKPAHQIDAEKKQREERRTGWPFIRM